MATPAFILALRESVGTTPLWLSGSTAVVLRDGAAGAEVLLVRSVDSGAWGPVAGIVDPGEHPHLTAEREVAEEAGVRAEVERLVWLTVTDLITYDNGDQTRYIDHVFRCRWISGDPIPDTEEVSEAAFFAVDELPSMPAHAAERIRVAIANQPETKLG